jgi:hypothetical protein
MDHRLYFAQDHALDFPEQEPHFGGIPEELSQNFMCAVQGHFQVFGIQRFLCFHTSHQDWQPLTPSCSQHCSGHIRECGEIQMRT